jgi:hypothetical protein
VNLAEHTLKVATLAAIATFFSDQAEQARRDAEVVYRENGIKKLTIALPDGELVGDVTVKQPGPTVKYDEAAFLKWVEDTSATEIEEYLATAALLDQELIEYCRENGRDDLLQKRIRKVWRSELEKRAKDNDGDLIDESTGEATTVATVTKNKPTGAFALSQDPQGVRAKRLIEALLAGELNGVIELPVTLALPASAEAGPDGSAA